MDKQEKKLKFNIIDVAFVAVVLAGLIFVVLRVGGFDLLTTIIFGGKEETYVVSFIGEEVADYVVERIQAGDKVSDEWISVDLGSVLDVKLGEARSYSARQDGKLVMSDKENYSSIIVTCYCSAVNNGNGITVGNTNLGVGHTMVVRIGDAKLYLVVHNIQKLDESPYAGLVSG